MKKGKKQLLVVGDRVLIAVIDEAVAGEKVELELRDRALRAALPK